jgi:L-lactate dehydrogenase complex protein LldF
MTSHNSSSSTVAHFEPIHFKRQAADALANPVIRHNFRHAMDYLRQKRVGVFPSNEEFKHLQGVAEAIKQSALNQLPSLLETLETQCIANGIKVHWAETRDQANEIINHIIDSHNGKSVVKGKSMATEEIELNSYLEAHGKTCIESDMGEYIVQLAGEHPSHIIMPAIHKNAEEIGHLFAEKIKDVEFTTDVDTLINIGRVKLRERFMTADIGITGVNFAVAQTGTLCLVENEGNGRMTSTVPNIHIAVTGIEKVIPDLDSVPPLLSLLTRSATGQIITTYFNMISGPRKADERDGPKEVHLVLLDNGRTQAYADEQFRATLQCIRCGACMNHCPVYTRIGGHAYGTTYPGPIGKIISPHLEGLKDTQDLPTASSLCGACEEVCPVNIPIPQLLQRLRKQANLGAEKPHSMVGAGSSRRFIESHFWPLWSWLCRTPRVYHFSTSLIARLRKCIGWVKTPWNTQRATPTPAPKTLNELLRKKAAFKRAQS